MSELIQGHRAERVVNDPTVDIGRVRAAVDAARQGDGAALERLALALLEVELSGDLAVAIQALARLAGMPRLVLRLDETARAPYWAPWGKEWPGQAADRLRNGGGGPVTAALVSMHADGRVREAAVAAMLADPVPATAPFLVLRTTDWARQVRNRARAGFAVVLHDDLAGYLPAAAMTIALIERRQRADFARNQVDVELRRAPASGLRALADSDGWAVRRMAFEAGLDRRVFSASDLVKIAARSPDLTVRGRAADCAARDAVWTGRHDLLEKLADARDPRVRALGLTGLVRAGRAANAVDRLADDNGVIRAIARDAARRCDRDAVAWYRSAVVRDRVAAGALVGLAECGVPAHAELLRRWLADPAPRIRAAAVYGLRLLDAADPEWLSPMLHDPSSNVVRQVAAALRPRARSLAVEALWRLLAAPHRHQRRAAYDLLQEWPDWTPLRAALVLAVDPDNKLAYRGQVDVVRWIRGQAYPSGPVPAELLDQIVVAAPAVGERITTLLRSKLFPDTA